jgi:FkbM family methyltransferase
LGGLRHIFNHSKGAGTLSLDLATLRRTYHELCAQIRTDPRTGLLGWTLDLQPGDLLTRPLICVANENLEKALGFLDKHANVVGIVNDFKLGTPYGHHRCISTDEMVELHRNNPEIILVNSTVLKSTQRYFDRVASQNDIPTLTLLQFYRTLRVIDGIQVPIQPNGLLEAHDPLAYFDAAVDLEVEHSRIEAGLASAHSKATLFGLLLKRLTGDTSWHLNVRVGDVLQPFGPDSYVFNSRFFEFNDNEVYVDAGAYRGETVALFANAVHDQFKKIHAFEPDPVNYAYLEASLFERFGMAQQRVQCHRAGTWEKSGRLKMRFSDGDGIAHVASHFELVDTPADAAEAANLAEVDVVALDERLAGENVTFIKLEVEGAEVASLNGARRLILDNRPKLALSAYHRARDLVDVFEAVESLDAGYRIDLAHHHESVPSTVFYCVPQR